MITFAPFKVEDLERMAPRIDDKVLSSSWHETIARAETYLNGPAETGFWHGEPVAAGGILPLWRGVGEAWFLSNANLCKAPIAITRRLVTGIRDSAQVYKLHRVQAVVHADNPTARRFMEWLTFENEGLMRGYGADGADYYRYAKVFTWR